MTSDEQKEIFAARTILVRAVNWIGDAVMMTPSLGAIRQSFPSARITVLANPLVAQLFTSHPWVDEVLIYDQKGAHRGLRGRLQLAAQLRARGFDLAILLQNAFNAALITWLARIPLRIGNRSDGRGVLLSHGFPLNLQPCGVHESEQYLAMLRYYGITGEGMQQQLDTTFAEDLTMGERLAAAGVGADEFLLGINPGATYGSAKRWYPDRFAAVARSLAAEWGARVVITGGPGEKEIAAEIERELAGACINLAGQTTVRELMALIKRCNFFVTNDSGPMHLAAAFAVPLVAIFGSTDHTTTYPLAAHALVVRETVDCAPCLKRECPTDHRCMTAVTAAAVVDVARELRNRVMGLA